MLEMWTMLRTVPADTGRKLNVHKTDKTFRRRPGRFLNVVCMFNLCHVSTGEWKRESVIRTGADV